MCVLRRVSRKDVVHTFLGSMAVDAGLWVLQGALLFVALKHLPPPAPGGGIELGVLFHHGDELPTSCLDSALRGLDVKEVKNENGPVRVGSPFLEGGQTCVIHVNIVEPSEVVE